ncbi:hypothetical protein [Porphyromonas endodontalis]|jgi:hypothetical protein|uniref:hypothetical protein n=1 Tax=Porphyromonas endodontalis TaxID=28124 RepID=UPI0028E79A83|nr:hypothetical protein [Porphyromonas endodontalis]
MFDFLNTTYSGLLSILSALFGLSYPLVIGCIEKIDSKFRSTKLSERFQRECSYKWFKIVLLINLAMAVLSPFLMEWCADAHAKVIMGVQVGGTISMIISALCLFRKIISYYNIAELQKEILDDYKTAVKKQNKVKEEKYFIQWIDLSGELLKSADDKLVQSVYEVLFEYVEKAYKIGSSKALKFDPYYYDGISRINEFLSKGEARPISVNNTNSILTSLILIDSVVSETTYRYLWRNLKIQLFYNKEEWIMKYWESASQKIRLFMNTTYISPYNKKGELDTKKMEEIKNKKKQREEFLEFHIMLCSMLLQQKKYELLEQMLSFTQTEPPSYPLVPSTFSEILDVFNSVNHNISINPTYYESRYQMPKMHGITEGKIAGAANCYLALLAYRIYAIRWDYGYGSVLNTGALPNTLSELATLSNNLNIFKYWLGRIRHDQELLQVVGIRSLDEGNEDKAQIYAVKPDLLVSNMQDEIHKKMENLKITSPLNDEKVASEQKELTDNIRRAMKGYADLLEKRFEQEKYLDLNSSISVPFLNTAFWGNSDVNHFGTAECVSSSMLENFRNLFASAFFVKHSNTDYELSSDDLFEAIDKLALNKQHYIIAFGIYFDYYIGTIEGLEKESAHKYTYNKIRILSLDCSTEYFSQMLYIMEYEDLPFLDFLEPSEEEKKNLLLEMADESCGLWLSIKKISEHPNLLTEPIKAQLGDKADQHSLFTAIWRPGLFFKGEKYPMVSIKVKYRLTDEGDYDSVDKVKPFPKKATSTKQADNP